MKHSCIAAAVVNGSEVVSLPNMPKKVTEKRLCLVFGKIQCYVIDVKNKKNLAEGERAYNLFVGIVPYELQEKVTPCQGNLDGYVKSKKQLLCDLAAYVFAVIKLVIC